jgi:hypothetical protein
VGQRQNPQRPFRGAAHRSDDLTLPGARHYANMRHSHWNRTQRPQIRNPNSLGLMLASRLWLCAATCPGRVLARDPSTDYCTCYSAQLFLCCRSFSLTGSQARMQCHDDMHLLEQGSDLIYKRPQAALPEGQRSNQPCQQSIIGLVKPTTHPPPLA